MFTLKNFFVFVVNKQLADKERVAAALENSHLIEVVNQCLVTRKWCHRHKNVSIPENGVPCISHYVQSMHFSLCSKEETDITLMCVYSVLKFVSGRFMWKWGFDSFTTVLNHSNNVFKTRHCVRIHMMMSENYKIENALYFNRTSCAIVNWCLRILIHNCFELKFLMTDYLTMFMYTHL